MTLFPTRIVGGGAETGQGRNYHVSRDGRFLINAVLDEAAARITLLTNWSPDAKNLAPAELERLPANLPSQGGSSSLRVMSSSRIAINPDGSEGKAKTVSCPTRS